MEEDFFKYPEIVLVERRPEILQVPEVIATEKLHGTNFRVRVLGERLIRRRFIWHRNDELDEELAAAFYGGRPVAWFRDQPELLARMCTVFAQHFADDVTLYGEICGDKIQRGVSYTADPQALKFGRLTSV